MIKEWEKYLLNLNEQFFGIYQTSEYQGENRCV